MGRAAAAADQQDARTTALESHPAERSAEQVSTQSQLQRVLHRLDAHQQPVKELQQTVIQLASGSEQFLEMVCQVQKHANNLGEDLVDDMLLMDRLTNLTVHDRSSRKAALSTIDRLLADVDAVKARLAELRQDLSFLKEPIHMPASHVNSTTPALCEATQSTEEASRELLEMHASSVETLRSVETSSSRPFLPFSLPDRSVWTDLHCKSPQFRSEELLDHYVIQALIPGLDFESLHVELSSERPALSVIGLRLPASNEAEDLRLRLIDWYERLALESPDEFAQVKTRLDDVASKEYARLGQGQFGWFSVTFEVPRNVDNRGVTTAYQGDVLRILLPKVRRLVTTHPRSLL